jgi:hypothetical protein
MAYQTTIFQFKYNISGEPWKANTDMKINQGDIMPQSTDIMAHVQ